MVHSIKKKVLYLSLILSAHFVGRSFQKVNNSILDLNEIPTISTAFQAIANKLLSPEVFEKAFSECEIQ